jgi:hypothetical protein
MLATVLTHTAGPSQVLAVIALIVFLGMTIAFWVLKRIPEAVVCIGLGVLAASVLLFPWPG